MQFFKIFEIKFNPSIYFLFREYFFHIKLTKPIYKIIIIINLKFNNIQCYFINLLTFYAIIIYTYCDFSLKGGLRVMRTVR